MNVIFLDFDGVIDTYHYMSDQDVEEKIKILSTICKETSSKVVIEAAAKDAINEETNEIEGKWVNLIFNLFNKYGIECIGRTPNVKKYYKENLYTSMWKEDEIRLYLLRHPEITNYCVIDDDDLYPRKSDLNKVRNHLVKTIYYSNNKEEEGLLPKHLEEVQEKLKEENEIRKLVLKYKKA